MGVRWGAGRAGRQESKEAARTHAPTHTHSHLLQLPRLPLQRLCCLDADGHGVVQHLFRPQQRGVSLLDLRAPNLHQLRRGRACMIGGQGVSGWVGVGGGDAVGRARWLQQRRRRQRRAQTSVQVMGAAQQQRRRAPQHPPPHHHHPASHPPIHPPCIRSPSDFAPDSSSPRLACCELYAFFSPINPFSSCTYSFFRWLRSAGGMPSVRASRSNSRIRLRGERGACE